MIDIEIVKERYSQMSDEQLIHLLKTEAREISPEARQVLEQEFVKRNLDTGYFVTLNEEDLQQQKTNHQQIKENLATAFTESLLEYAFLMKKEGKTNAEILEGLSKKGIDAEESSRIMESLKVRMKEMLALFDKEIRTGAIFFGAGLLITFVTYSMASGNGTYVVAWGAITFGAIRFFKALHNKEKYQKVFTAIQSEKENDSLTERA